ncbi:MAG: tetratricopeptide repeat protein [Bacteroidales bacterium]
MIILLSGIFWPSTSLGQPSDSDIRRARELFSEGVRNGVEGKYRQALVSFDEAISLDPYYTDAYLYRGLANIELRQYEQALEDFRAVIGFDHKHAEQAHYFTGLAYASKGKYNKAIHHYSEALRISPDYYAFFQRGKANYATGEFGRALQDFDMAHNLNPGFGEVYYFRGRARYQTGLYEAALEDLLLARESYPEDPVLHYYLGHTYQMLGNEEIATEHLSIAEEPSYIAGEESDFEQETRMLSERLSPLELAAMDEGFYKASLEETSPAGIGIQIASFVNPDQLPGIASGHQQSFGYPVFIQITHEDGRKLYKLLVGEFSKREEALRARSELRDRGFKDSFLILYPRQ